MRKILLVLMGCLAFCACEPVDLAKYLAEPGNPNPVYVFPAVDDGEPLAFHLIRQIDSYEKTGQTDNMYETYVNTPGYSKRMLVIATLDSKWTKSSSYASYFDRLAAHFSNTELEFALLFLDFEKQPLTQLPWVQNLQHVRAFYNTESRCQNKYGLCSYVLEAIQLNSPQLHYIVKDKASLYPSNSTWPDTTDEEELEKAYEQLVAHTQRFLDKFSNEN